MLNGSDIRQIGVVGAGLMGRGIAGVFAQAGYEVSIFDSSEEALNTAVSRLRSEGSSVRQASSLQDLAGDAHFVFEAVVEDLGLKQQLFAQLDQATEVAILASNTSVLPITSIAALARWPERIVGTHWWNPPHLIPIVEVVRGQDTATATMNAAEQLLRNVGKLPVRVEKDVPGFVGNRLQHALWREAIALVADGVCDAQTVDLVVRNTIGLRLAAMGPMENADYVGLDMTLAIHNAVLRALNADREPSPLLRGLVDSGQLGAKSGQGFLSWGPGDFEAAAARLAQHVSGQVAGRTTGSPKPATSDGIAPATSASVAPYFDQASAL